MAPDAARVVVRAFDQNGAGSYANTIRGINWILNNAARYHIRIVNMSFGAAPQSYYWDDPLAQAVMKLWQSGIVVVAAAGNEGPAPQTIDVPGNVPYVITVGASTDNYTPSVLSDDSLASFSSTGPTFEGFVKPEVIAPGGHVTALMHSATAIAKAHREFHTHGRYFTMSGTSQSAAAVTGIEREKERRAITKAATLAQTLGLEVHAGHGLDYGNVAPIAEIPEIIELNIGHSIIARAVIVGIEQAVREMKELLSRVRGS